MVSALDSSRRPALRAYSDIGGAPILNLNSERGLRVNPSSWRGIFYLAFDHGNYTR